jgi:hypothetical protein
MRVLCCGSRKYDDGAKIFSVLTVLSQREKSQVEVIHGGQRTYLDDGRIIGADFLADVAAKALSLKIKEFLADWSRYGRSAGPIRNQEMLDEKPDLVLAFGWGKGTSNTVRGAEARGIPVERHS